MALFLLSVSAFFAVHVFGIDNGLGINPPMGWRSWNCYHANINQSLIEKVIDAMVDTSRNVDGKPMSFAQVGYTEVGVDDNWQLCDSTGHYFHNATAPNGIQYTTNAYIHKLFCTCDVGWANINFDRFPNLDALVHYAHEKNLGIGWYMANCICSEHEDFPANEANDVSFLREYKFDGVKLDGCSSSGHIDHWQDLINSTGSKPLLTENCHNGPNYANLTWCPMNFFRSSTDIVNNYVAVIGTNLRSVIPYSKYPGPAITRQGCFAYPDMLEVGNFYPQYNATVESMDRTHFGAWCVVSAPLILGYDVTNSALTDQVWDVLTNREAIAVSQTWAGHPGTILDEDAETIYYEYDEETQQKLRNNIEKYNGLYKDTVSTQGLSLSAFQIWGKPQPNGAWAVLMMNNDGFKVQDLTLDFTKVPGLNVNGVKVRSIWEKKDLGTFSNSYTAKGVLPFDSQFLMITPS